MAKKKAPERVTVEGFTWEQLPVRESLRGGPLAGMLDRWALFVDGISVRVIDFGEGDDDYRSGWRVVAGAPEKERYETRDEAMVGAVKIIHREVRAKLDAAHKQFKAYHDMAKEIGAI